MTGKTSDGLAPMIGDGLGNLAKGMAVAMGKRMLSSATGKIGSATERLTEYVSNGGGPGLMGALTGRSKGGGGGGDKKLKVTNIVEHVDVGVPVRLAYNQWTQFTDFPSFTKKVEHVEQIEDQKLRWKAQIFLSHRSWESTITEQVPDRRIVWRSKGEKGSVDGAVTFHELAPELTRIVMNLQYHPQGFFEHTGNLWRAPGRRARLELKHFARHVMNEAVLHPDEIEGWRGEIHDGEVVKDHETAVSEEQEAEAQRSDEPSTSDHRAERGRGRSQPDARGRRPQDESRRDGGRRSEARPSSGAGDDRRSTRRGETADRSER